MLILDLKPELGFLNLEIFILKIIFHSTLSHCQINMWSKNDISYLLTLFYARIK